MHFLPTYLFVFISPIILSVAVLLYTWVPVVGDAEHLMRNLHWIGPSPPTRWIRNLKRQLADGGLAYVKDNNGVAARVAGDPGYPQPRTTEVGAVLKVRPTPMPGAGEPPTQIVGQGD